MWILLNLLTCWNRRVLLNMNKKHVTLLVLLDLSVAFDTILFTLVIVPKSSFSSLSYIQHVSDENNGGLKRTFCCALTLKLHETFLLWVFLLHRFIFSVTHFTPFCNHLWLSTIIIPKGYILIYTYLTFMVNFFFFSSKCCFLLVDYFQVFFCFRNINCGQSSFFPILYDFSVCWWTDFTGGLTGVTQRSSPSESFFIVFQEVILVPYRLVLLSKNPLSC